MKRILQYFKKLRNRGNFENLETNQKYLMVLGAEIMDEYAKSRSFRRIMDKTRFGNSIKNRIKNWDK